MPKTAIIVGYRGQDGTLLSKFLCSKGYRVIGISRAKVVNLETNRSDSFSILKKESVNGLLKNFAGAEVYYLASNNSSSEKNKNYDNKNIFNSQSYKVNVSGVLNFLEAIKASSPTSKLFYASTSHIFESTNGQLQDESTRINPDGIYGQTKAEGTRLCQNYRDEYGLNAFCGILFNHESSLRTQSYVTAKIINAAIDIAEGNENILELGSPQSKVDWSYAEDFIFAFYKIMQLEKPDDFVLSSGRFHTVERFTKEVFKIFALEYDNHIKVNPTILERSPRFRVGNPSKLYKLTGVNLKKPFKILVNTLVKDFLYKRNKKHLIQRYEI